MILAENNNNPLILWSLGWVVQTNLSLKKKNIKGKAKKTVKKYLAQVICKKDISALKYLAIVSIKGNMAHANRL